MQKTSRLNFFDQDVSLDGYRSRPNQNSSNGTSLISKMHWNLAKDKQMISLSKNYKWCLPSHLLAKAIAMWSAKWMLVYWIANKICASKLCIKYRFITLNVLNPLTVLSTLAAYKNPKTIVVQTWSTGLAWQHQSCPWAGYGVTRSFSWVPRFACTRPLWCPFCCMLQKLAHYFRVTKKRWRHSTRSANAKSCTYTGLSMTQTQKYPLAPACHLLHGLHQKMSFVGIRPHSSAHSGDSSTQRPTLPSWPSIRSFTL